MKIIVALLFVCLLSGCSKDISLSEDPIKAAGQIEQQIPIGTRKEKAEKILASLGIDFSEREGSFGPEQLGKYIYGDLRQTKAFITKHWQCALVLNSNKVVEYRVTFGLIGP